VAEIMTAVDEGTRMTRCADGAEGRCLGDAPCLTHGLWQALGDEIGAFLSSVSLKDVLDGVPSDKRSSGRGKAVAAE
jgi:DNA-binding IscR family transcriptional regulator